LTFIKYIQQKRRIMYIVLIIMW